jgi:putative membrane protein
MRLSLRAFGGPAEPLLYLGLVFAALIVSVIDPYDGLTWILEVAPVFIAVTVLIVTRRRFPLTPLSYRLIFVHALILILGGHYSYARVPIGFWIQDIFDLSRNHYDRIGHIAQGFIPAIVIREYLVRTTTLRSGGHVLFLTTSVALAFSAVYEMIEWWTAVMIEEGATEFLGTQGDVWDTQWDMFLCLCGALMAQLLLTRIHDRQIERV